MSDFYAPIEKNLAFWESVVGRAITFLPQVPGAMLSLIAEVRRQRARIAELERRLDEIGKLAEHGEET